VFAQYPSRDAVAVEVRIAARNEVSTTRTAVLVTGVGGGGLGHEVLKSLRLAEGYKLVGVDASNSSFGFGDVDEAYVVPPATDDAYIATLIDLCVRRDVQVVIPGSEPELRTISAHRALFAQRNILPLVNTTDVIATGLDKDATMTFLDQNGFARPRSLMIEDVHSLPVNFPLPAIVKPASGGGGSSDTFVVQEQDELDFVCRYLVRQKRRVLVQEYVGTPTEEYTVGVLHNLSGEFVGSIAVRRDIMSGLSNRIKVRNRTARTDLGPMLVVSSGISQGEVGDFSAVRAVCERIAAALGSCGPLNIQCRVADGQVYPFEINPRFSGTTYLRALAGYNEPDLLIRHHLLGQPVPPIHFRSGRIIRGLVERRVADLPQATSWIV
jgi:carbamoyl-phosphate synthase large subunit